MPPARSSAVSLTLSESQLKVRLSLLHCMYVIHWTFTLPFYDQIFALASAVNFACLIKPAGASPLGM